jgi:hypothetical protein
VALRGDKLDKLKMHGNSGCDIIRILVQALSYCVLHELFPFKVDKGILFHAKFNENDIHFFL